MEFHFRRDVLAGGQREHHLRPGAAARPGRQRQLPACTAADELADAEAQLCAAEEAAVVLDGVFLHQAAAVVFYPERDARLFLFQAHPHPAACIAGPQRVGDEVEQQLFGLIGDAHDGAVLDAPALRRERYFQRPLDVRGQTPRLFQQTAQVQRLQLAQLFIFQLIKCYGIAYRAVQPGRLYLDVRKCLPGGQVGRRQQMHLQILPVLVDDAKGMEAHIPKLLLRGGSCSIVSPAHSALPPRRVVSTSLLTQSTFQRIKQAADGHLPAL